MGPHFTSKLRSLRTGLPAVKEFEELSTKLEFDEFDDTVVDGGQSEGKITNRSPRRRLMKVEEGRRTWKMESRNLSQGRKQSCQHLMNTNDDGR